MTGRMTRDFIPSYITNTQKRQRKPKTVKQEMPKMPDPSLDYRYVLAGMISKADYRGMSGIDTDGSIMTAAEQVVADDIQSIIDEVINN